MNIFKLEYKSRCCWLECFFESTKEDMDATRFERDSNQLIIKYRNKGMDEQHLFYRLQEDLLELGYKKCEDPINSTIRLGD